MIAMIAVMMIGTTATSGGALPGVQRVDTGPFAQYDASLSSALRTAAMKGQLSTVQMLISQGADVNAANGGGLTPLGMALIMRRTEAAEVLVAKGARLTQAQVQMLSATVTDPRDKVLVARAARK